MARSWTGALFRVSYGEGRATERWAMWQGRVIAQYVHGAVSKNATGSRWAMAAVGWLCDDVDGKRAKSEATDEERGWMSECGAPGVERRVQVQAQRG